MTAIADPIAPTEPAAADRANYYPDHHAHELANFSERALSRKLRDYQRRVAGHILRSVVCRLGITFTVMMARQMGKNELSYHLLSLTSRSRLHMWSEDPHNLAAQPVAAPHAPIPETLSPEAAEFWREARLARPIHRSGGLLFFYVPDHLGHDDFLSALALLAWTVQPEPIKYETPLTPTHFIYPEPEDVRSIPFAPVFEDWPFTWPRSGHSY